MNILTNEPLLKYTNFRIGGLADYFIDATNEQELFDAIKFSQSKKIPWFLLGGGTNILIGDRGFRGLVIRNKLDKLSIVGFKGSIEPHKTKAITDAFIKVESGVLVNRLVRFSLDQGLTGLENFLGQPGTIGGAMWINAHNMKEQDFFGNHITEAIVLTPKGEKTIVSQQYFKFGYDTSILQKSKDIVLSVIVRLQRGNKTIIWNKANQAQDHRTKTQPQGYPTAGCVFKNISLSEALRIGTPNHTQSAGYLIDSCGLKGYRIGGAQFSNEHANFIMNIDSATAHDVVSLIKHAKREVQKKYKVSLKEEFVFVGEF